MVDDIVPPIPPVAEVANEAVAAPASKTIFDSIFAQLCRSLSIWSAGAGINFLYKLNLATACMQSNKRTEE